MREIDLAIIGSGPAGLTAAVYAGRGGMKSLIIEGPQPGGQLTITGEVENFPGFPDGISGAELMERMHRQAEKFGGEFLSQEVIDIDFDKKPFIIKTSKEEIVAKAIIYATGASARWLGIESEKALTGKGVSACATCDGFFFKDQDVVVVGGGDVAIEEAMFLTKFAKKVTIIHRRDQLRATLILADRAKNNPKIDFAWNSVVTEIKDVNEDKVTGVILKDTKDGSERFLECDGVFMAIGYIPRTDVLRGKVELDDQGYLIADGVKTSVEGVFAAGDCVDHDYRQAITAAASGCMAAIEVRKYLEGE